MSHSDEAHLNAAIYATLRHRLLTGKIVPGQNLSTRTLAHELGVSQTPVRDALSRLAAEGGVEIRSKRRVMTPAMSARKIEDLSRCRLLLEPEAAALALRNMTSSVLTSLIDFDDQISDALARGDTQAFMKLGYDFYFTLYRASDSPTLVGLIETLWLQLAPFMRIVYGRVGTAQLGKAHNDTLRALASKSESQLRAAISEKIHTSAKLISRSGLDAGDGEILPID